MTLILFTLLLVTAFLFGTLVLALYCQIRGRTRIQRRGYLRRLPGGGLGWVEEPWRVLDEDEDEE